MGLKTSIPWCDASWNPWVGCHPVSEACRNCYARREMKRYGKNPDQVARTSDATFRMPLQKDKDGAWKLVPGSVCFVCSWSDFAHPAVEAAWRYDAIEIMLQRPDVFFLILTKRPELIPINSIWPENIGLGVTVENQEMAARRLPLLEKLQARFKFVSVEPMLGAVSLARWITNLDWVICGGEKGPVARILNPEWVRDLRFETLSAGKTFFFKQWGEWLSTASIHRTCWPPEMTQAALDRAPVCGYDGKTFARIGADKSGATLDGQKYRAWPKMIQDHKAKFSPQTATVGAGL